MRPVPGGGEVAGRASLQRADSTGFTAFARPRRIELTEHDATTPNSSFDDAMAIPGDLGLGSWAMPRGPAETPLRPAGERRP